MYPLEVIQGVRLITDVCLEVAPGQDVLCIADREENMEILTLIAAECRARGAEVGVVLIGPRKHHHHEPPRSVARAMREADVVIAMTFGSLVHTRARKEATDAGVTFALMGEVNKEYLISFDMTREELLKVRDVTEDIARRLTAASSAQLTTRAGTNLSMSLEGRDARRLMSLLDTLGEETRAFAELGVNSNPFAPKKFIGGRLDMAIAGHVHLGLGRNDMIGGNSKGENHLDVQVTWATLLLDGKPILEDGNLKI